MPKRQKRDSKSDVSTSFLKKSFQVCDVSPSGESAGACPRSTVQSLRGTEEPAASDNDRHFCAKRVNGGESLEVCLCLWVCVDVCVSWQAQRTAAGARRVCHKLPWTSRPFTLNHVFWRCPLQLFAPSTLSRQRRQHRQLLRPFDTERAGLLGWLHS